MLLTTILHHYLLWHYSRAFLDLFHVWRNLLWFIIHFFSLPQLARSLIAPYRRITEERGETWSIEDLAGFVIIGMISRIIGFLIRTILIIFGTTTLLLGTLAGVLTFCFWVLAPAILLTSLLYGIRLLFIF